MRQEPKTELLQIRLTERQMLKLEALASQQGLSISQLIRNYIHRLPNPKQRE